MLYELSEALLLGELFLGKFATGWAIVDSYEKKVVACFLKLELR